MAALMFDTHAFVKELISAGMPEQQAEVLARSQTALIDEKLATKDDLKKLELATKRDLKDLEQATKQDIKDLEQATKRDIKDLEQATKRDIKDLGQATKRDIKDLEQATKRDLKDLELRLTVRLGSMMVVSIGVVAALVELL